MSVAYEHYDYTPNGDEAYEIIDSYRSRVEDYTRVEDLMVEFPDYAHEHALENVMLANLSDNLSGAFKWRGAIVGATHLAERGVDKIVAPSAGNHARGAILAAKALDMCITVVVPTTAPHAKSQGLRDLWQSSQLSIESVGNTFDQSLRYALHQSGELLHPYDNPLVMAGQGTIVDDVLRAAPDTKHLVMPLGGGGLAAGVLGRLEELGRTDVNVHLAEAPGNNSMSNSMTRGSLSAAERPNPRFGGTAVRKIGTLAYQQFRRSSNLHVLQVPESMVDELSESYLTSRHVYMREDTPNFEPTSLVAVAGAAMLAPTDGKVVVLGTGQNDTIYPARKNHLYRVPC